MLERDGKIIRCPAASQRPVDCCNSLFLHFCVCVCVLCVPHHFLLLFFYYHPVPLFFFASSSSVRIINAAECEKMQRPTNNNNSSSSSREMRKGHKLFTTVDCNTPKCVTIPVSHATDCCRVSERPEINFFGVLRLPARLHSSSTVFFFFLEICKFSCKSADSLQVRSPVGCK